MGSCPSPALLPSDPPSSPSSSHISPPLSSDELAPETSSILANDVILWPIVSSQPGELPPCCCLDEYWMRCRAQCSILSLSQPPSDTGAQPVFLSHNPQYEIPGGVVFEGPLELEYETNQPVVRPWHWLVNLMFSPYIFHIHQQKPSVLFAVEH